MFGEKQEKWRLRVPSLLTAGIEGCSLVIEILEEASVVIKAPYCRVLRGSGRTTFMS